MNIEQLREYCLAKNKATEDLLTSTLWSLKFWERCSLYSHWKNGKKVKPQ